jgi:hypothetical protein
MHYSASASARMEQIRPQFLHGAAQDNSGSRFCAQATNSRRDNRAPPVMGHCGTGQIWSDRQGECILVFGAPAAVSHSHISHHYYQVYYKDAFGAMLVYDISRSQTFETVAKVSLL